MTSTKIATGQTMSSIGDAAPLKRAIGGASDWKNWLILMLIIGAMYSLLYNGYWLIGGGDDAFYLTVARNLVTHRGYTWNGDTVVVSPPGWPFLLAGVMRISPEFKVLGLVPPLLMLASAGTWYWVLRRYVAPARALTLSIATAMLFQVFRCGMHFYSEAMFCVLLGWAMLLCLQIVEGREQWWRIALLALVCMMMMFERWAGVLVLPLVTFTLVSGRSNQLRTLIVGCVMIAIIGIEVRLFQRKWVQQDDHRKLWAAIIFVIVPIVFAIPSVWYVLKKLKPPVDRRFIAAMICIAALVVTFAVTRAYLNKLAAEQGAAAVLAQDDRRMEKMLGIEGPVSIPHRILFAGTWIGDFLWPIAEMGGVGQITLRSVNVIGWGLFILLGWYVWRAMKRGDWLWLGLMFYMVVLVLAWGLPVGRYIVPVAPLLVLGLSEGFFGFATEVATSKASLRGTPVPVGKPYGQRFSNAVFALLVIAVIGCNLPGLGVAVWVVHSKFFAQTYLAGQYAELATFGDYLRSQNLRDDEVSVNYGFGEAHRAWASPFTIRSLHFLIDHTVVPVNKQLCNTSPVDLLPDKQQRMIKWAKDNKIRFFFLRPEVQPARLWHLRGAMLPSFLKKGKGASDLPFYELYKFEDDRFVKVNVPVFNQPVARVPGM